MASTMRRVTRQSMCFRMSSALARRIIASVLANPETPRHDEIKMSGGDVLQFGGRAGRRSTDRRQFVPRQPDVRDRASYTRRLANRQAGQATSTVSGFCWLRLFP